MLLLALALVAAADASAVISEGDLKIELPVDARIAISDGPEGERSVALYQTRSRLLRILSIVGTNGRRAIGHFERYPFTYGTIVLVLSILLA